MTRHLLHLLLHLLLPTLLTVGTAQAQNERNESLIQSEKNGWEYEVKAGVNIGGASLRLEEKGMETGANVKNYSMEIINDGSRVAGYWTGLVRTTYKSSFVTLPVLCNYRFGDTWKIRAGLYVSYRMDGEFSGFVSEGYLREGSPVGEKVSFTDGKTATYNFTSDLRRWLWGLQVGWRAFRHFSVNADLTYGLNNIFHRSFKTITFSMHPIYLNAGFGYRF